jgi:hypothetical protein
MHTDEALAPEERPDEAKIANKNSISSMSKLQFNFRR